MFKRYRKIPWKKHSYKKPRSKLYSVIRVSFLFVIIAFLIFNFFLFNNTIQSVSTIDELTKIQPIQSNINKLLGSSIISETNLQKIINEGCPIIFFAHMTDFNNYINWGEIVTTSINYFTDFDSTKPTSFFQTQIAPLALQPDDSEESSEYLVQATKSILDEGEEDYYLDTPPNLEEWHFEMDNTKPSQLGNEALILLYNTHNAETYLPTDGKSKLEGKNAGIVKATRVMREALEEKYGLKTIHSETIHDFPDWSRSYINSMQTAQKLLKANKSIQAVFDVHRDAGFKSKSYTTAKINGKNAASILIVVGTEHSNWKKNLAFAEKLEAKANELYPNLVRDIRIRQNRRYNQNLHPQALLLEIGCDLNTLSEAQYSTSLFARVISEVLKEQ